jgi:hypothetical protein
MKRAAILLLMMGGAFGAWATAIPTAALTLDSGSPVGCFLPGVECWTYTLSITSEFGDIGDISSVTIDSVGGIEPFEFNFIGWTETVSGTDITFANPDFGLAELSKSLDGFLIESSDSTAVPGTYTYALNAIDPSGSVNVPGTASTPEPAYAGLVGLSLLAMMGLRRRFASR